MLNSQQTLSTPSLLNKLLFTLVLLFSLNPIIGQVKKDSIKVVVDCGTSTRALKSAIEFDINSNYSSSFLPLSSFGSLALNQTLRSNTLDEFDAFAQEENGFLYTQQTSLSYQHAFTNNGALKVGIEQANFISSNIDQDLISLIANGNTIYKGQTLNFTNSNLLFFNENSLQLEYIKSFKINDFKLFVKPSLQLREVNNFAKASMYSSSLFTEENAEYIDLVYNYKYALQTNAKSFSGFGFSGGLSVEAVFNNGTEIELGIDDLGRYFFNNSNFKSGSRSGEIEYSGIFLEYAELSNFGNLNINSVSDSLVSLIEPKNESNKFNLSSPYRSYLRLMGKIGNNGIIEATATYLPNFTPNPIVQLNYLHCISPSFHLGFNVGNGAFGGTAAGINGELKIKRVSLKAIFNGLVNFNESIVAQTGLNLNISYQL